jgi:hypothetical protein
MPSKKKPANEITKPDFFKVLKQVSRKTKPTPKLKAKSEHN